MAVKRIGGFLLAALLCCLIASGCSKSGISLGGFQISGLSSDELLCVGEETCPLSEAMIFVTSQKSLYQESFGADIWNVALEGGDFETYALARLKDYMGRLFAASQMAEERHLDLTEEELTKITEAAEDYFSSLSEEDRKVTGITKEAAEDAFRRYILANRCYETVLKTSDVEVSEDEARVMQIQQIFLSSEGLSEEEKSEKRAAAETLAGEAKESKDFAKLAGQKNEASQMERSVRRGELGEAEEKAIFSLSSSEVSGLLESEGGWRIVKCISSYDKEATAAHKEELEQEKRREVFEAEMKSFLTRSPAAFNEALWEKVRISGDAQDVGGNFYTTYQKYFGEG